MHGEEIVHSSIQTFVRWRKFNKGHRKEDVSEGENKMSVEPWNPSNEVFWEGGSEQLC